uniref:GATA-type domain-containing protein n=1 Tax=Panagrolaimus superbus TaxID=310955 RepID=A0A914Y4P6_9BILA
MEDLISTPPTPSTTTTTKELLPLKKQQLTTDCGSTKSSPILSPHDATRSATEDDEGTDLIYLKKDNGNLNGSANGGGRKRKQQQNPQNFVASSKIPKQESSTFDDRDRCRSSSSNFNTSMPVLTEQNTSSSSPSMTNQQLLDSLTLATVLGGTEANNEILNAFFQSALMQNDPNILMNVLNASIQDSGVLTSEAASANLTSTTTTTKKRASRKSSSKKALESPTAMSPFLLNANIDDLNEEQDGILASENSLLQKCTNCFATKTSAWRRNPDGQLICNACGLYYRMHQTNRPIYLRKNHIQTRYRKKNAGGGGGGMADGSGESSPMMLSSIDDENINNLNSSIINNYEILFGTSTMAK